MNNVVSLNAIRELRMAREGDSSYEARILAMDKLELLEEMMKFQEERSHAGSLSLNMMTRGQILFQALEERAETEELRTLTRSYRRHLKFELEQFVKSTAQVNVKSK